MPLFAAIGIDHPPHSMEKRNAVRSEHREHVRKNRDAIEFVGILLDDADNQCGSVYIIKANNEDEIRDWFKEEAFYKNDVYKDFVIRRIEQVVNHLDQQDWPKPPPLTA